MHILDAICFFRVCRFPLYGCDVWSATSYSNLYGNPVAIANRHHYLYSYADTDIHFDPHIHTDLHIHSFADTFVYANEYRYFYSNSNMDPDSNKHAFLHADPFASANHGADPV